MNRIKRGCLEIKGRKHFVYEGLNIIGRNKDATIILPDASVSHNQSIIVIAKGCHYVGDTKSRNGTFLNDLKLSPLELYDLNMGNCIKFGLVVGIYTKLKYNPDEQNTETQDVVTEVNILENIFDTPTQVLLNDTSDKLLGNLKETVAENVFEGSINELPTQIINSNCDIDTEVNVVDTVISVHDMPTQILDMYKEGSDANESLNSDQQNESRISSGIIEETINDDTAAFAEIEETSKKKNIASEDDVDDDDDENSRESIDFLTMQPAATQSWFSDSQTLLQKNVLQLKNRVKYVIMSDEDSTTPIIEDDGTTTVGDSDTDIGIGGPSTSLIDNRKRKKLTKVKKKVPIIRSDSDTDVEKEEKEEDKNIKESSLVTTTTTTTTTTTEAISAQVRGESAETEVKAVTEAIINSDSDTDVEGANVEDKLDDSDIIPTSQQVHVSSTEFRSYSQLRKGDNTTNAVVSQNTKNFEASLADSFQLILTDSSNVELDEEEISNTVTSATVVEKQVAKEFIEDAINGAAAAAVEKESKDSDVNKGESQMELEFVDNNVVSSPPSRQQNRPKNPLFNIFNAEDDDNENHKGDNKENEEGNGKNMETEPSAYDAIEDNLKKMFAPTQDAADMSNNDDDDDNIFDLATQKVETSGNKSKDEVNHQDVFVKPRPPSRSRDELFLQPTQILPQDGEDIFSLPTQICANTLDTKLDHEKAIVYKKNKEEEEDSAIFFQPTQILTVDTDLASPSIDKNLGTVIASKTAKDGKHDTCRDEFLKPRSPPSSVTKNIDDEIFLEPTQILPTNGDEINNDIFSMSTQVCADLGADLNGGKDDDDEKGQDATIFLQPTQLLTTDSDVVPSMVDENPVENKNEDSKAKDETISEVNVPKNDIFLEPTQILDNATELNANSEEDVKKKKKQSKNEKTTATEEDAIFMQPTQIIQVDNDETRKNIDDSAICGGEPMTILINDVDKVEVDDSTPTIRIEKEMEEKSTKAEKEKMIDLSISNLQSSIDQSSKRGRGATRKTKVGNVSPEDDEEDAGVAKKLKTTETKSKVENKVEKNLLRRRSTRKKSVDEKRTDEKSDSNKGDLYVIEEINSPTTEKNNGDDDDIRPSSSSSASTSTESMVVGRRGRRTTKRILSSSSSITNSPIPSAILAESMEESSKNERPTKRARKGKKIDDIPITPAASTSNDPEQSILKITKTLVTRTTTRNSKRNATPSTSKNVKEIILVGNQNVDDNSSEDDFVTTIPVATKKETKLKETPKKKSSVAATRSTRKMKIVEDTPKEKEEENSNELEDRLSSTTSTNTDSESTTSSSNTNRLTIRKGRTRGNKTAENVALSEDDFQENRRQKGKPPATPKKINTTSVTPSLLITPDRNKRKLKPKIVFTMLESPQLETIIRSLGGIIVDSLEASTVLVTGSVKRSQKLLAAVGYSKPICSPKWLHESKKANTFLDPWEYILKDEEAEEKWNFSLKESLRRSGEKKLLENFTFQLLVNSAQDVLKGSIESCGGKCVSRAPAKDAYINFVIVANAENRTKYARFLKQTPKPKIVAPEAIFDGVLRQELHFDDHSLT